MGPVQVSMQYLTEAMLVRFIEKLSQRITTIFNVLAGITFDVLPSLQFILLFYSFGSGRGGSPAVRRSVYLTLMILVSAVMVYFYITALENEKDRVGWACMIAFLQLLWAMINFTWSFKWALPRFAAAYVFGSVGVVLLNSVALMIELIMKTVNGEGVTGDMRITVFSSEFIFTLFLMVLMIFEPWITPCLESCQNAAAAGSDETPAGGSNQNQNTAESHETNPLLNKKNQETQTDSVVTQK
ncbi:hypothetical protein QQF64_025982 [Cirrhinus molitorella]|uniref:Uncharacterized protein n=1 Tax=Cirrhinus molitorella TaxID=172907 RepID=A0ABR3NQW0_9TELE